MDSKSADSGMHAEALDLSAKRSWDLSRADRNGVCLIPYLITALLPTWPSLTFLFLYKGSRVLLQMIHCRQNWSLTKKNVIFGTVCLVSFAGVASVNVHQLAYVRQASYYHKSPVELSYSIAAGVAGQMGGPLLFIPISSIVGRSSLIFWSLFGSLASNIWAPLMTRPNHYIPFVMSRLLAGLFGSIPPILANGFIMDLYFLHQRGKAFTVLEVALLASAIAAPVFGGFIADTKPWPNVFWWLVALITISIPLAFLFLEETGFARDAKSEPLPQRPSSFMSNRVATFFPGTAVVHQTTGSHIATRYFGPIKIGLSPVTMIIGLFVICIYGFAVGLGIILSIYLQTPEKVGGYGFTPKQNAEFNFVQWADLALCLICGAFLNDRIPLWISRRRGGAWHLEYRLYPILIVAAVSPIGFGIFGAGIQYHLHCIVLALGTFLVVFGACYSTPISVNYIIECFKTSPLEVAVIMNVYRQILALALPFFIIPWEDAVSAGWRVFPRFLDSFDAHTLICRDRLFGMMALFCVFSTILLSMVIWKGPALRRWSLGKDPTEDGVRIISSDRSSDTSPER